MDRRQFATGLAAGAFSTLYGDNFARAVPYNNDIEEEVEEILRRLQLGPLERVAEGLPKLLFENISDLPEIRGRLNLISLPSAASRRNIPLRGISEVVNLDRDLITTEDLIGHVPDLNDPEFEFAGNVRLSGDPAIVIRPVSTNITLNDGATITIGGLIHDVPTHVQNAEAQLPVFGELPVIGHMFRRRTEMRSRRNLMIFVTARIILPDEEAD